MPSHDRLSLIAAGSSIGNRNASSAPRSTALRMNHVHFSLIHVHSPSPLDSLALHCVTRKKSLPPPLAFGRSLIQSCVSIICSVPRIWVVVPVGGMFFSGNSAEFQRRYDRVLVLDFVARNFRTLSLLSIPISSHSSCELAVENLASCEKFRVNSPR